ncbi:GNAT family N-acetyltransferase [Sphingomonas solaris]|uniref:GNAT family N-acetyltransferase n=2 Tax=Alterirhizorhabdus solaris TaxID=2529389 RepID=A0A558QTC1_9SPHN|nr:GNAT family N-acetyltransferase [Sphingomonas solaris]
MSLRAMEEGDIPAVHALSKAEKWPHRVDDLAPMLALGHGIVAEMGGKIVGTTIWWPCGDKVATLGIVIVSRTHRGAGIGRIVMEAVLDAIGDRTILLNATDDGLPLYRKLGFQGVSEILQHQGAAFSVPIVPLEAGERLRPVGLRDADRVAALVEGATGLHRPALMAALLKKARGVVIDREGELLGVALFRRFGRGYVVGPVVAPDPHRARALISHWVGSRAGKFTRLDITGESRLGEWLDELGLVRVGRVVTMVKGEPPVPTGPAHSFAIVSQALG